MDKGDCRRATYFRRPIGALIVATLIPVAAGAVTDQDLAQIRESIKQLEPRHAADQARIGEEAETKLQEPGRAAPPTAAVAETPAQPESPATKALTSVIGPGGNITFTPGFRVQGRYAYDDANDNNDFFLRRFRLKAKGEAFNLAKYYAEIRFDQYGSIWAESNGRGRKRLAGLSDSPPISRYGRTIRRAIFQEHADLGFKAVVDGPQPYLGLANDVRVRRENRQGVKE